MRLADRRVVLPPSQASAASTLLNAPGGALTVDLPDKQGRAPLLHGAALGHVQLIKTCLMADARIDAADHQGTTPLMAAVAMMVPIAIFMSAVIATADSSRDATRKLPGRAQPPSSSRAVGGLWWVQ